MPFLSVTFMKKEHKILEPQLTTQIKGISQQFADLALEDPIRVELMQKFEQDEFAIKEIESMGYGIPELREMTVIHPVMVEDPLVFYKGKQIVTYL